MKRTLTILSIIVAMVFLVSFTSYAQRGPRPGGPGEPGPGANPPPDLLTGIPFDITGEVVTILFPHGLEVATDSGNVIVRGMPPQRYWDEIGVSAPTVGETVQVTGFIVTSPEGEDHYVAMAIVVNGQIVELRDADTGRPLWAGSGQGGPGPMPGPPPEGGVDITSGTPFDVTGQVATLLPPHGFELETADTTVDLFGIGPRGFWDEQGVALPEVGDTVQATGYILDFNGLQRYVVVSMTVNGQTIELRDAVTGEPLWRPMGPGGPGGPGRPGRPGGPGSSS